MFVESPKLHAGHVVSGWMERCAELLCTLEEEGMVQGSETERCYQVLSARVDMTHAMHRDWKHIKKVVFELFRSLLFYKGVLRPFAEDLLKVSFYRPPLTKVLLKVYSETFVETFPRRLLHKTFSRLHH